MIMAFWDVIPCNIDKKSVAVILRMFYTKDAGVELFQNVKFTTNKNLTSLWFLVSMWISKNALKTAHLLIGATLLNVNACIAWLIRQSVQLQAQVTLASLGRCHKSGKCAKSCTYRSARFCDQRAMEVPLFGCLRSSCNHVTEVGGLSFVRLAENDGDFVDVIVLYTG
jgi:hypothetical protein